MTGYHEGIHLIRLPGSAAISNPMLKKLKFCLLLSFLFSWASRLTAQDPARFQSEIEELGRIERPFKPGDPIILFTGSSSIRMWSNVQDYFPDQRIINTGFGGSHMSDLLFYADELILKYAPAKVFIYEGDNDIAGKKRPSAILKTAKELIAKIEENLKEVEIVLISAKPSLARWSMKNNYRRFNRKMERLAAKKPNLGFVNVWDIMLDETGNPRKDIFMEDGLHMNQTGYDLWAEVIRGYLK